MFLIPVLGYCLLWGNKHICPKDASLQWQGCVCVLYMTCFCRLRADDWHCISKHPITDTLANIHAIRHWCYGMWFCADLSKNHLCHSGG